MLEDLNQASLAPSFWNDNEKAQKTLRKKEALEAMQELPESSKAAWSAYLSELPDLRLADDAQRGF